MKNSGLDVMIDADSLEDIARLYRLSIMVPEGLPCIRATFKRSIERRGGEVNRASLGSGADGDDAVDIDDGNISTKPGKHKSRPPGSAAQTLALALKWVQDVLDLKDKFDQILKKSLQSNRELESGFNEVCAFCAAGCLGFTDITSLQAFESFVNLNNKAPEYMSLFIDDNLKRGLKGVRPI